MPASRSSESANKSGARRKGRPAREGKHVSDGLAGFAEQFANRVIRPLDLVLLTRERIQETLDEAAERGRVTRADANELVAELLSRGRQQTDELLKDLEQLLDRGREQLGSATRRVPGAGQLGRLVRGDSDLPIQDYDELTAAQVGQRLAGRSPAELRRLRDYERRHANRKSALAAIERALGEND